MTLAPQEAVERALERLAGAGIALATATSEADLRWANSMLTTNGERSSMSLTVIATRAAGGEGQAAGSATGPVTRADEVDDLVGRAVAAAADAEAAEDAAPLVAGGDGGTGWDAPPEDTSGAVFADVATGLGEAFARGRADGVEHFGYCEHSVSTVYLGSSTGLRLRHSQPTARFEMTAKSHGRTRSAWVGRSGRDLADVDVARCDDELRLGLSWQARRVEVDPGRHDAVLSPSAIADLMVYLVWSASARDAADGRTVFSRPGGGTRVGERLTDVPLTLASDPADPEVPCQPFVTATWSSPFGSVFDNGLPLSRTAWVDRGELTSLVTTRHTAALTGLPVRPPIDNLRLDHADGLGGVEDLVARTEDGLLLNCLWYIREVDPATLLLTGLTRDGVYVVREGEVVGAASNFRFNVSPVDLLAQIVDAGEPASTLPREWADFFSRAVMPAVRVEEFNFSTRSDAL